MAAFGRKQVARAQSADEQRTAQGLDESVQGEESQQAPIAVSAPPIQAPAAVAPADPAPVQPAAPALGRPSFRPNAPAPAAPVAGARPVRMPSVAKPPAAAPAPVASGAAQFAPRSSNPASAQVSRSPGGYEARVNENSRRADGLSLRLERALDEVCDYNGYTQEQREEYKSRAAKSPAAWEERILKFYNETIKPARSNNVRSLEEAIAKRPGRVVFMVVRAGKSVPHEKTVEEAGAESLFHGTTVEQVRATHTPFKSPREVYGRADANTTVTSDDAVFEEPVAAARAPRP